MKLRPAQLARLLNSTPLGTVTNERQIYRHRIRAGFRIGDDRRVDLFRYVAWLIEQKRLGRRRRRSETVSLEDVRQLLRSQGYRCALSGRHLTPDSASLDHIVAISRGGEHRIENAQILHRDVNRAKGVLNNEDFLALCREVVRWTESNRAASGSGHRAPRARARGLVAQGRKDAGNSRPGRDRARNGANRDGLPAGRHGR